MAFTTVRTLWKEGQSGYAASRSLRTKWRTVCFAPVGYL